MEPVAPSPAELAAALRRLPPRAELELLTACVGTPSIVALATHLGTTEEAASVVLLEALEALAAVLGRQSPSRRPWPRVQARARDLSASLAQAEGTDELASLARRLSESRPELVTLLERARAAEESGPARRVETWLRRAAIVGVVAASAWFYAHRG